MKPMASSLIVVCDESGNEGDNLSRSGSAVFAHGSVTIDAADAADIMREIRADLGSKSVELKSKVLLLPGNEDVLKAFLLDSRLLGNGNVHLSEKRYFLSSKVVDTIVETVLHERGHDLHKHARAFGMAQTVYKEAPAALGPAWDTALDQFNTMLRLKVRSGEKATLDEFYNTVEKLQRDASGKLRTILGLVLAGRYEAKNLVDNLATSSADYLALDPLFAAVGQTTRTWAEKSGSSVEMVHDNTNLLTPSRVQSLITGLAHSGLEEFGVAPIHLTAVRLVDSKSDARVQVADLLAGAGRLIAEQSLEGVEHPLAALLRPYIDPNSLWGDDPSWLFLTGRSL